MMIKSVFSPAALVLLVSGCSPSLLGEPIAAPPIHPVVDGVTWGVGNWEPHLEAGSPGLSWGNHRAVVQLLDGQDLDRAIAATIPWRRPDSDPGRKAIVVVDATSGEPVTNWAKRNVTSASGQVIFEPVSGSLVYHVYYLPWESTGSYYPRVTYPDNVGTPDAEWLESLAAADPASGTVTGMESVDEFHSFFPMEVVASDQETEEAMKGLAWALFPEHRDRPISLTRALPQHWATDGPGKTLSASVLRGEYFTFQIGVFAYRQAVEDLEVSYDGFPGSWTFTCFNCEGVDLEGQPFTKTVSVEQGRVQALWFGVQIPESAGTGPQTGTVSITPKGSQPRSVEVDLSVLAEKAEDHGFNQPEFMSRLEWLNSTVGTDPDFIIDPFIPVEATGKTVSILGRDVDLRDDGLPAQIWSYYTPELTGLADTPEEILAAPIALEVTVAGEALRWESAGFEVARANAGRANWTARSSAPGFELVVEGALEYDGMLDYRLTLKATESVTVEDVALPIAYQPDAATYMLGLGRVGGRTPGAVEWKWKVENHQEGLWLGGVHKGLQYVLRDENYIRPLNTNFYLNQPLNMPPSWFNDGQGGISLTSTAAGVTARNYSGTRSLEAGEELYFNVRFLITPFKPIRTDTHFQTRFVHKYVPVDSVVTWGGTVVNIHHANEINPYINYPFFNLDLQTAYIQEAHQKGIKVKLYDTIRELTYRAYELQAMKSLGDEIINDGEGGGHSWMQEHLRENYHSAWHAWRVDDAAMLNKGTSRWTNYYIAGLSWLARNQQIDGLYLDDIAFSRETVKRLVSVLDEHRDEVVIDLHSANQFNPRDGFISSAMLYMEHMPFISRLWFGEYFDYGAREDYWMTEVSGLPFGLMGEMLQDGGHPYRGMLYGMTTRMYGEVDPRPVWGLMNDFGIDRSRMLGYWLEDNPVKTSHPDVLATTYSREGEVLIALASWSEKDEVLDLSIDLDALGLAGPLVLEAPAVLGLQDAGLVDQTAVRVPAGMGLFVTMRSSASDG
ncbi:MAG: hypothetical protein ACI80V_000372 [Rhodothermales bacterium]|jgi:hypothetical protein